MRRSALLLTACATWASWASADPQPTSVGQAQLASTAALESFSFHRYLREVAENNLDLVAERASVSTAEAQIAVARVFPDPQVTAGLMQYDVTRKGNPTATIVQLGVPLEIGGQRGARVSLARAALSTSQAELLDFLRGLRANAANDYVDALHARSVLVRSRETLASLERLVAVNQERFNAGEIGEASVIQSRVEANQFRAAVIDAEGNVLAADTVLVALLGSAAPNHLGQKLELEGDLKRAAGRHFDAGPLLKQALAQRADLIAARRRLVMADRQIDLARANRVIPLGLGATWQHNFEVGTPSPIPASDFLGATVTVPLPLSHVYRGELDAAYSSRRQAEALARAASINVEADVRGAVVKYEAASERVRLYTNGVLADADQVLEKTLYNYRRGGATLVEVLVAQRTVNDVYISYFDSLAEAARALIAVEQASGAWDVDF